jgi:hypothetical protein
VTKITRGGKRRVFYLMAMANSTQLQGPGVKAGRGMKVAVCEALEKQATILLERFFSTLCCPSTGFLPSTVEQA